MSERCFARKIQDQGEARRNIGIYLCHFMRKLITPSLQVPSKKPGHMTAKFISMSTIKAKSGSRKNQLEKFLYEHSGEMLLIIGGRRHPQWYRTMSSPAMAYPANVVKTGATKLSKAKKVQTSKGEASN